MKRRLLAIFLAAVFVMSCFALSACNNEKTPAPGTSGDQSTNDPGGSKDDGTKAPEETQGGPATNEDGLPVEFYDNYKRDEKDVYYGKAGLGGSKVLYDSITVKVSSKNALNNNFDDIKELPENIFSTYGGTLSDWTLVPDEKSADNNRLKYSGSDDSILTFGNPEWGRGRFSVSYSIEDGGEAKVYFCVKDEKNYYRLTITTSDETGVVLDEIKDGKETNLGKLAVSVTAGVWTTASFNISENNIVVFVDAVEMFHIAEKPANHTYSGLLGIGQWNTEFYIDDIVVTDPDGKELYRQDFEDGKFLETAKFGLRNGGNWSIANTSDWEIIEVDGNHVLHYKNSGVHGSVALFDAGLPENCTGFTFSYRGYKVSGSEGYPCVWDWNEATMDTSTGEGKDYICFNLGGWSGQAGMQIITGGNKTNVQNNADVGLVTGEWQEVKLVMTPESVFAYFHDDFVQVHWY